MDRPDADLLARLTEGEGAQLLASLPPYAEASTLALGTRLRTEGHDPALVAAALTQSRLRAAARVRLGPLAEQLLLTQDGLEQATRPPVAARRALRLRQAGLEHVWDLGCGLGLDARGLAEAGLRVTAVESDPAVAVAARANLADLDVAEVWLGDATEAPVGPHDGAFLDPARRTPGVADVRGRTRRVFRLEELSPSWAVVQQVAATAAATGAKLSPGFPHAHLPSGTEAEWVSVDGSVVECALWWRAAVRSPGRKAVIGATDTHGGVRWTEVGAADSEAEPLSGLADLGPFLVEPDRAVLAAGRIDALTARTEGQELDPGTGYVSAPTVTALPWARWYAVREALPLHAKTVRGWLRERGVGRVTIKKRGVPTDPDQFRADLRLRPGRDATEAVLVLTRVAGTPVAVVVEPVVGASARIIST
ncbi:class I SAM-dependent methyltransferase [Ornithinimicrobium pratense]|uniref:Class I SAM-dependent methyltransferase n=1 Tax=Ornithinimicrobium pratense TaxID=2593973 RepID=A0A5J6V5V8_9MICO|nr:class I SAM-dependent methyltransferase [Ornithinimicrobium pratense]QFG69148.1 class I SAM-dependent methyltransferase [Ornithinimicrobium pratense]